MVVSIGYSTIYGVCFGVGAYTSGVWPVCAVCFM